MLRRYEALSQFEAIFKKELEKRMSNYKLEIKKCNYKECNHLWVSLPTEEEYKGRLLGCVKCGLTNSFVPKFDSIYDELTEEEKASFEYMNMSLYDMHSIHSNCCCDLELGMAVYNKIKEVHPYATDKEISNYLSYALWKMRTRDQSEERKASRVRRLGLRRNFNAWNPEFEQE